MKILSRLYSQALMIEPNSWASLLSSWTLDVGRSALDVSPVAPCSACGEQPPPARYLSVLEFISPETAVITIEGVIMKHLDEEDCEFFGLTDLDDIDAALAHVAADANIRNVVLNFVNCPGGTVIGVPETAARVAALALTKNVTAYSDSMCASAGVYIATQASEFFVSSSAYAGSIGVIQPPIIDLSRQIEASLVTTTVVKAGKFKDMGSSLRPVTKEEVALLEARTQRQMEMFTAAVLRGRPRMAAASMEGQLFFGQEIVDVGLADGIFPDLGALLAQFQFVG